MAFDVFDFLVETFKYVDDTTVVEAVDTSAAIRHLSTRIPTATSKARYTELIANAICSRATEIGMRVNGKKTQLLLISPPNGYEDTAFITMQADKITSTKKLKLLGFVFGSEPNVKEHVEEIKKKFRSRF